MTFVITGMSQKQEAVHTMLMEQDGAMFDRIKLLEPVLTHIGGVHSLAKVVSVLVDIGTETAADAYEIATVLALIEAAHHGEVLSVAPIDVEIDDERERFLKRDFGDITEDAGFLLSRLSEDGPELFVFVKGRRQSYRVLSGLACDAWKTTPEALAEHVSRVFIDIDRNNLMEAKLYVGNVELDECATIEEFFRLRE